MDGILETGRGCDRAFSLASHGGRLNYNLVSRPRSFVQALMKVRGSFGTRFSRSMSDLETRRFVVTGRVQGVGFRWFVEREAAILGITGWVRNRDNGSVEVMATGTREHLASLHKRLREGPRAARVDDVAVSPAPFLEAKSFGIEGAW